MPAGEDLDHVHAIERKLKRLAMALTAEALAAARNAHHQHPLGHDFRAQGVAHLKKLAALDQPFFETFQAADFTEIGAVGNVFDHAAAIDQQPLLLEHGRQRRRPRIRRGHARGARRNGLRRA